MESKRKIQNIILIVLSIVLFAVMNYLFFVNDMTLLWGEHVSDIIGSIFPVSLIFVFFAVIFFRQMNDEKYRDKSEVPADGDNRKVRLSLGKGILLLFITTIAVSIIGFFIQGACQYIYYSRMDKDKAILDSIGWAYKKSYDFYMSDLGKESDNRQQFNEFTEKLREGTDILTLNEMIDQFDDKDSFDYKFNLDFQSYLCGTCHYSNTIETRNLRESLFLADENTKVYVKMTDSMVIVEMQDPITNLKKNKRQVQTSMTKLGPVPDILFCIMDESDKPKNNAVFLSDFGTIFESQTPYMDYDSLAEYLEDYQNSYFYSELKDVGKIDRYETMELYQMFTSCYEAVNEDSDEAEIKELREELMDKLKVYLGEYAPIDQMNVVGIYATSEDKSGYYFNKYSVNHIYSITNDEEK